MNCTCKEPKDCGFTTTNPSGYHECPCCIACRNPISTPTEGWEAEFDKKFPPKDPADVGKDDRFKHFIRQEKERSYLQGRNDAVDYVKANGQAIESLTTHEENKQHFGDLALLMSKEYRWVSPELLEAARSPKP